MSLFRRFRGHLTEVDDGPIEPAPSRQRREVERARPVVVDAEIVSEVRRSEPRGRLARGPVVEALGFAVRHLRAVAPSHREEMAAIEEATGRAMLEEDYREVADGLRALRFDAIRDHGDAAGLPGIDVFHRVLFGTRPVATAMALRGAEADLDELLLVPALSGHDDRALLRLMRVFETFALQAVRTRDGAGIMKACVAELIDTLSRLASDGEEQRASLSAIRERLVEAEDREDLEQLRERLLHCVSSLVAVASQREEVVRDAFVMASESQQRARALEVALTDAEEQARTDALTGLSNRRGLEEMVERAARRGQSHGVLALDLDHFKRVNDQHGHAAGDAVLCFVAALLRGELRGDDRAFRVGGEELVVMLPDAGWQGARATAERLRSRLARAAVRIAPDREIDVTMSVGVGLWTPPEPFAAALEVADLALYRAKEGGRNRVVG